MPPSQVLAEQIGWDQIHLVVDRFYSSVQTHPTLATPFARVQDWPKHKERLTYFWWVVLGGARTRQEQYEPIPKHFAAGFSPELLADWLVLFTATVEELVPGELAGEWLALARKIGSGCRCCHAQRTQRVELNEQIPDQCPHSGNPFVSQREEKSALAG